MINRRTLGEMVAQAGILTAMAGQPHIGGMLFIAGLTADGLERLMK